MIDCLKPLSKEKVNELWETFKKEQPAKYWECEAAWQKTSKRITVSVLCVVFAIIYTLTVLLLTRRITIVQIMDGFCNVAITLYFGILILFLLAMFFACVILPLIDKIRYARKSKKNTSPWNDNENME